MGGGGGRWVAATKLSALELVPVRQDEEHWHDRYWINTVFFGKRQPQSNLNLSLAVIFAVHLFWSVKARAMKNNIGPWPINDHMETWPFRV